MLWSLLPSGAAIVPNRVLEQQAFWLLLWNHVYLASKNLPKSGKKLRKRKKKKRVLGFDEKLIGNEKRVGSEPKIKALSYSE